MRIGFSLPFRYLSGTPMSRDEQLLAEAFGPPSACLELLRLRRVTSIELGRINANTDPGEVLLAAARVLDAGLGLTLHGYLPDPTVEGCFATLFPPLASLAGLIGKARVHAVMVLHSYRGTAGDDLAMFMERSVALLRRLALALERENLPWRVALEITRNQGRIDPGDTYQDLLEIRERVGHEVVGFCWDVGHAHWNVLRDKIFPAAPPEFLKHIIHTHLHDLAPDGQTHWPLTERRIPLGTYIGALSALNYQGVYNIELYPSRWAAVRDVKESILASLDILKALSKTAEKLGQVPSTTNEQATSTI